MEQPPEFVDLLLARRNDCDILWASRPMESLAPHKLPPESKYSRQQMIQAVLNDERVKLTIVSLAKLRKVDVSKVVKEASMMANEMASKARLPTVRWIGVIITKVIKRIFLSIYINESAIYRIKKEMQISQVQYVFAPSHRSYLDFILLSYILFSYDMALPNIASGMDFYQMYIIGELLRQTGAFYIRRTFSTDLLYKRIFQSYVMCLVEHSDRAIEFFIEGTRSRSLKSIVPKFGLLSTILESLLEGSVPDIHFVPISINYERPPEELLFAYELLGVPKPKESTTGLFQSLSILQKPCGYGRIFFNIGEPISACHFLSMEYRKTKVLSPYTKLSSTVTEKLAYSIIDSHKKNTILMPFNIIALLFNERSQTQPDDPYTLDTLVGDYLWCKNLLQVFNATVHTERFGDKNNASTSDVKEEILNTLKPHEELLGFDESKYLRLRERHKTTKLKNNGRVKGHTLSEKTMQIAVSVVNISIYLNPTLSFFIKPAIVTLVIGVEGVEIGAAFKRYELLRTLLSTEFAMPAIEDESMMKSEWEETLNLLLRKNYISIQNNSYIKGHNLKVLSLLYNVMLPFVDVIYITCLVLFEWKESISNYITIEALLIEGQKQAEAAFFEGNVWGKHPYSLSLDLFNTTISNLIAQGILVPCERQSMYQADKIRLALILTELRSLSLKRPVGSYYNMILLPELQSAMQSKL
ncbi:dihydroxyacetone phosphate acyltransferase [Hylaeus volcanicus]|uniref:dihydroxyacetone phosphate acyltransferase n=1 Tax=Hylaeus volcanicus TaxID=313075 RepID=UPI0023B868AD|nr:dihydroxyacetone phosphate acyltransferase [Hylaeus volcanicus]XP_053995063.1 dihydroxyacetone phosphate acyltransferase [Hylaeus volcanicus]XP_053995064.1 dihydroxyacetone phosphate acyltransferase [Hylaeus volcanicus]XP_053995065.1 dihydroxyacetone phosphate acyltransferase [Hylaeus volcanicus]XP_053995066.1 dihydroxyacetone phosphate acyltransferase [Hylaeus volcanicus]